MTSTVSYPLLPGNRWSYRDDAYEHYRWRGRIYTDTVRSLLRLDSDLTLVVLDREETGLSPMQWTVTHPLYWLILRDELYRTDLAERAQEWIDYFMSAPAVPTAAPNYAFVREQELEGRPAPLLRLPVSEGDQVPVEAIGANRTFERVSPSEAGAAGESDECFRAFHPGNFNGWMWFCNGVGITRQETFKGGSWDQWGITTLESEMIVMVLPGK